MKQKIFARFLLFITVGHTLIGLIIFYPILIELPKLGWINSTGFHNLEGSVAVWFLLFAWPLFMITIQFWNQQVLIKNTFLICGFLGSIIGISLMPASGFWLLLILCAVGLYQNIKYKLIIT
ncbi:MAG: hypothetical protein HRU38_03895 [Saccharospirillaceae bacterium]|nr:DUF6463 family protein [Pseudomonadales bacterium]NRB77807.1 hypothetical protein [Saccharospirillaceae bacterium]